METYEANFYQPENLVGCIRDSEGDPRILCFKKIDTGTIGRIVLHCDHNNPFENVGRSVVFSDVTHRRGIREDPDAASCIHAEKIGEDPNSIFLYWDKGRFEPVSAQNREQLAALINNEKGLMEGQKGILKGALDILGGELALLNDFESSIKEIVKSCCTHIVESHQGDLARINQCCERLQVFTENAPQIDFPSLIPVLAHAYPLWESQNSNSEGDEVIGSQVVPSEAVVTQDQSGIPSDWCCFFEVQNAVVAPDTPGHPTVSSAIDGATRPETGRSIQRSRFSIFRRGRG